MGKGENRKKDSKKKPAMTMQEKKNAKREKKNAKIGIGVVEQMKKPV